MAVLKGIIRRLEVFSINRDARALIGRELRHKLSCYNHPTGGDYNNEALIFKMDTARFLGVLKKKRIK